MINWSISIDTETKFFGTNNSWTVNDADAVILYVCVRRTCFVLYSAIPFHVCVCVGIEYCCVSHSMAVNDDGCILCVIENDANVRWNSILWMHAKSKNKNLLNSSHNTDVFHSILSFRSGKWNGSRCIGQANMGKDVCLCEGTVAVGTHILMHSTTTRFSVCVRVLCAKKPKKSATTDSSGLNSGRRIIQHQWHRATEFLCVSGFLLLFPFSWTRNAIIYNDFLIIIDIRLIVCIVIPLSVTPPGFQGDGYGVSTVFISSVQCPESTWDTEKIFLWVSQILSRIHSDVRLVFVNIGIC